MKNFNLFLTLSCAVAAVFLISCATSEPLATKYVIRRVTTSGVCQVYDSQAAPIGVVIGGGPFNTKDEATKRMCELRTDDANDRNKCFQVNPSNACDTTGSPVQASVDLPESFVTYLDSVPVTQVDIDEAILQNGVKLGVYRTQLVTKSKTEVNKDLIFPASTPQEQLSQLILKFFSVASDLVDDAKHPVPKGADDTEPEQLSGLAYNYSSRDIKGRQKMFADTCKLKVIGLDCSGFLFQVFSQSQCKGMNLIAAEQSKPANLNAAINGVITGVEARDKGKLSAASLQTGDIVYWDKLAGATASHIGIVLKSGETLYVYQSNGSSTDCDKNISAGRGPRTLSLNETYWFGANANWKVLRYEVV